MKTISMAMTVAIACAMAAAVGVAEAALPKVMVLVDEKSLGTISTSEIEAMAVKLLGEKEVETVDQDMVQANLERVQKALKGAGDNRGAAALGREFGADVVLLGEAVVKPSARRIAESNLRAYQAAVTLRAVRTDNAVNLASASEDASVVALEDVAGSAKALKAAGKKALDAIIPAMLAKWEKTGGETAAKTKVNLDVTVGGVDQIWKLKATREKFKAMGKEIASVAQQSYAQGVAVFRIVSLLPSEELAEAVVMDPPPELKIQVVEIKPGALSLRVVEAEPEADEEASE
ncbi:MAG: hypothetical protein GX615_13955 [Lentisphaerae bacterium]|jgi:hypothetical protein|nr:hypothetical protein [Lentisphaerota bacterium]